MSGSHVIVCGDNALAFLVSETLIDQFGSDVTAILPSTAANRGPDIARLSRVEVIEAREVSTDALRAGRVEQAEAVALVDQDDVANIHAALRVHELNPDTRLVIRFFNMNLGNRIRTLFPGCAVLSDSATAAPSFVAAALGEVAPSYVRLPGGTLYVARKAEVSPSRLVCGLSDGSGADGARLLPLDETDHETGIVLAITEDPAQARPLTAIREGSPLARLWLRLRVPFNRKLALTALALLGVLAIGTAVFAVLSGYSWPDAIYLTVLDTAGAAQPDLALSPVAKATQAMITIAGIALIPVVTAAAVDAVVGVRLATALGRPRPTAGHVVVVGLGNVGSKVVAQLHDLGVPVVCVESDEHARGVALARRFGLPIVFGDASREDTLRAAYVGTSRALVAVTSNDVTNLEAGLHGRTIKDDLRVVLRLFDNDLAQRVQSSFGITISCSVSFLAAPAFAAAMVRREVLGTIPVGRSVLLIAEVPVRAGSALVGLPAAAIDSTEARLIAIHRAGSDVDLQVAPDYALTTGDELIILATRSSLGAVLARSV